MSAICNVKIRFDLDWKALPFGGAVGQTLHLGPIQTFFLWSCTDESKAEVGVLSFLWPTQLPSTNSVPQNNTQFPSVVSVQCRRNWGGLSVMAVWFHAEIRWSLIIKTDLIRLHSWLNSLGECVPENGRCRKLCGISRMLLCWCTSTQLQPPARRHQSFTSRRDEAPG